MQNDPIVEEVHRVREALAAQFNYDVKAIFADMRTREMIVDGRLVAVNQSHTQTHSASGPVIASTELHALSPTTRS